MENTVITGRVDGVHVQKRICPPELIDHAGMDDSLTLASSYIYLRKGVIF